MNAKDSLRPTPSVDLGRFSNPAFDRGRSRAVELAWLCVQRLFFQHGMLPTYGWRRRLLRTFGANVGEGLIVKPRATITFPWRLTTGRNVWIGEEAYILNLAWVTLGDNVCVSQRAFLCTGSHDWSDPRFGLIAKPIVIQEGAWIAAGVFVGPGVTVGRNAVATAGSVVTADLPADMICTGNPCVPVKRRTLRDAH